MKAKPFSEKLAETGVILVILTALYRLSFGLHTVSFAPGSVMGAGTIFFIGLTASVSSCLAMVGGLLLSVSGTWDKLHPKATRMKRFEPQAYFNVGRIVGYFVLGGLTGLLGQELVLSSTGNGVLKIALSLLMVWLGLGILDLLPKRYCTMPIPNFAARSLRKFSETGGILGPFVLGALTYFIPCGFTQSMQLLALQSGGFVAGGAVMGIFALGTLPALLGIGLVSSFTSGRAGRLFILVAGCASLLLGIVNLNAGLSLTGVRIPLPFASAPVSDDPRVTVDGNGQQIISVRISNAGYDSDTFIIKSGMTTWIYATADSLSGCLTSMVIPSFGVNTPLKVGENWIGPIRPEKDFAFMCSAGIYRADVQVRS